MKPGHTAGGDSKPAVRARSEFLNTELYRPAAVALAEAIASYTNEFDESCLLIDAGCGEGYYTSFFAQKGLSISGVDLSKFAVDAAAKRMVRQDINHGFFAVAGVHDLPFFDSVADVIVNIFAPCVEKEFSRVLKNDGILAVMYAGPDHLMGLKQVLYDRTTENDGRADLPQNMQLIEERRICFDITVSGREAIENLFAMTPYYWRTSPKDSERLLKVDELTTPIDMVIGLYRKTTYGYEENL